MLRDPSRNFGHLSLQRTCHLILMQGSLDDPHRIKAMERPGNQYLSSVLLASDGLLPQFLELVAGWGFMDSLTSSDSARIRDYW